ncbi:MAG: tyrosine-type recombinase/integrase [Gemmataceae bacterium]
MTDEPINPLRRRMIEEMTIRHFSPKVQQDYLRRVKNFADFFGRSPARAQFEDIRRYQLHLAESGVSVSSRNVAMTALRFFFGRALKRPQVTDQVAFGREPKRLPIVLSQEEMGRFLAAAPSLKYQTALSVAYAAGLRVSEVVSLKIGDIDSTRMVIRVVIAACATGGNGLRCAPPRRLGLDAIALPRTPKRGPFCFTGADGDANAKLIIQPSRLRGASVAQAAASRVIVRTHAPHRIRPPARRARRRPPSRIQPCRRSRTPAAMHRCKFAGNSDPLSGGFRVQ